MIGSAAHEDERDGQTKQHDLTSELDPGNAAKMNIDDQAGRLARSDAVKQRLGRGKKLGVVAGHLQQVVDRPEHRRIVVYNSNNSLHSGRPGHSNNRLPMRSMFCIGPMNDPIHRATVRAA